MNYTFDQLTMIARAVAKCGRYGITSEAQALVRMLSGMEMGLSPIAALRGVHDIKGKDTMDATLMRAAIITSGKCASFDVESTDKLCTITTRRVDGFMGIVRLTWTLADAIRAELYHPERTGKEKMPWEKFPRALLLARCTADVGRMAYADVLFPTYTPEELDAPETPAMLPGEPDVAQLTPGIVSIASIASKWHESATQTDAEWTTLVYLAMVHGYTEDELREECEKTP